MKAVVLEKTCNPDELKVSEVEKPKIRDNWVLVKVLGFGINRAEVILRDYEADEDYINIPVIPGIECVGEIVNPSNTDFKKGEKVIGLMGGMGRSFNGSYAEYTLLPSKNVFKIPPAAFNHLTLEEIISIPETYFTAFGSVEALKISEKDTVLIRGATSSLGLTAIQLIKAIGAKVIATTRDENKFLKLKNNGADKCIVDDGELSNKITCSKVLELIGPKTLEDSMKCLNNGICCITGVLGGVEYMDYFDPIKIIPNDCYLTSFFSNYATQKIINNLFNFIIKNNIKPNIAKIFTNLEEISEAHKLMESNKSCGKIIFKLET